ncbi:MAG: SRPBCC domain-containing protein [Sphingomonadales bacterium]|jgi:uncharacterized protein YndB with AHSA1/START domain
MSEKVFISTDVKASKQVVWSCYTDPAHIVNWNFASDDWHCPRAENNLTAGGKYAVFMEAKDGSFGFNLEAVYRNIAVGESFVYVMADGREVSMALSSIGNDTRIDIVFDAESVNPVDLQRQGWQSILNNFKKYTESLNQSS